MSTINRASTGLRRPKSEAHGHTVDNDLGVKYWVSNADPFTKISAAEMEAIRANWTAMKSINWRSA